MRLLQYITATILLFLLLAGASYAGSLEDAILKYTNEYRRSHGKHELRMDPVAADLARDHSRDMAQKRVPFGHTGFNKRVKAAERKTGKISAAAENVAYGQKDAAEVVKGWIKSPAHHKNLLGDFTRIGIGTARSKNGSLYFTQLFLR